MRFKHHSWEYVKLKKKNPEQWHGNAMHLSYVSPEWYWGAGLSSFHELLRVEFVSLGYVLYLHYTFSRWGKTSHDRHACWSPSSILDVYQHDHEKPQLLWAGHIVLTYHPLLSGEKNSGVVRVGGSQRTSKTRVPSILPVNASHSFSLRTQSDPPPAPQWLQFLQWKPLGVLWSRLQAR